MLEIKLDVSEQVLKDRTRWLKLRSLLLGAAGDQVTGLRRGRRRLARASQLALPGEAGGTEETDQPRLLSNLQKAAYALQRLHDSEPNPSGYTAHQMALYLREENIDALSAEQLSWALATLVSRRQSPGKPLVQRIRRGRYLPTEYTRELFA